MTLSGTAIVSGERVAARMKNISIIGATFYGNRGAEAMLSTVIGELSARYGADARFAAFSYYPENDKRIVHDEAIRVFSATPARLVLGLIPLCCAYALSRRLKLDRILALFPEDVRFLAESGALLCIAGVSFIDSRIKVLPYNIATLLPALSLGVPVIKLSQAMGPFEKEPNRTIARLLLPRLKAVFARGRGTYDYAGRILGTTGSLRAADDLVFLFTPDYSKTEGEPSFPSALARLKAAAVDNERVVGLCPSTVLAKAALREGWDYGGSLVRIIEELSRRGYTIALYPNATRPDQERKTHNNDLPLLSGVWDSIQPGLRSAVIRFEGELNAKQIRQVVAACGINLVSRFHAMVMSLSVGVPCMVIGWSHKYLEVMERFGQSDLVLDCTPKDVNTIIAKLEAAFSDKAARSARIVDSLEGVKLSARAQIDYVASILD